MGLSSLLRLSLRTGNAEWTRPFALSPDYEALVGLGRLEELDLVRTRKYRC